MTTPSLSIPVADVPSPASTRPPAPRFPNWIREPLLHFVALGGLLFAVDHYLVAKAGDPHTIVVGADVDSEAIETFEAARGRKPDAKELEALHKVWLDNEILYREGLALQVDKGDTAIRERVIFKMLSVVDSNVRLPTADDATLHHYYEAHREKYDQPARFDFEEAALSGDSSEAAVRDFVKQLNGGLPGDAKAGLRVFKDRPESNIVQAYGEAVAKALAAAKPGEWQALETKDGWRAMRVSTAYPPKSADFADILNVVRQDWVDATASEQRSAAVRALAKKYKIKYETATHGSPE